MGQAGVFAPDAHVELIEGEVAALPGVTIDLASLPA
jgi:hypothetical protein